MVFASLTFLYIFLPLNLILYYVSKNAMYRNVLLTVFSFVFYAWGEPIWISLLFLSALVDYLNGLMIQRNRKKFGKLGLVVSVCVNLGLLMSFKYSGFIVENVNTVFGTGFTVPSFALPVGISFYSFQTLSYVIDVYRGEVKAQKSFMKFLMFVSLYHQLVAGPIVRYAHIAHEIDNRKFNIGDISSGITRFCIGLFKKVCIANVAGQFVVTYLEKGNLDTMSVAESWFGIIMFSIQIYFDFSGYSDMAIGLGKMFGFHYHENFNYPYISRSATEFWRRWHISLGTFFRDYVYIPLGGNKQSEYHPKPGKPFRNAIRRFANKYLGAKKWKGYRNLFIVWFLTGFWHGASWNFIFWGLFFGFLIFIERAFLLKIFKMIPNIFGHVYLLFAAVIGWAIFYFTDLDKLWKYLGVMFGASGNALTNFKFEVAFRENLFWMLFAMLLCMPIYLWIHRRVKRQLVKRKMSPLMWGMNVAFTFLLLFLATSMLVGNSYNPFIYYRF